MSAPAQPSYLQSLLTTLLLLGLLAVTAPISFAVSGVIYLTHKGHVKRTGKGEASSTTVLVTGARTTKSLFLARTFWKAGYRVVLADEREWGRFSAARWSRAASAYYNLPDPTKNHREYERAIRAIIHKENVKLWVPGSSAGCTLNDAQVAEVVRKHDNIQVFIQTPREAEQLHNKDLFGDLCKDLGFAVPESILVHSVDEALQFLHADARQGRKYIVKCTALDDQGRSDLTQLPFESQAKTRAHLQKLPRGITSSSPYVLQQFIPGFEFCTHCHAVNGVMQSFLSCPSSDMLMRYMDCRTAYSASIADSAEQWTRDFLEKWNKKLKSEGRDFKLTGHFSFDFIVDPESVLYPIECNPRIHTAAVLLSNYPSDQLAKSYFGKKENGLITPFETSRERYSWVFHSLPIALACAVLPRQWTTSLHPLLTSSEDVDPFKTSVPAVTISPPVHAGLSDVVMGYVSGAEKDPMLDWDDPLPFAMQHLTWAWLLSRLVFIQGKGWSRANVSTSRIFST